jgi:hypothetical protein
VSIERRGYGGNLPRQAKLIGSKFQKSQVNRFSTTQEVDTIYCVSPYKTGTTFLIGALKRAGIRAAHEPLHLTSLRFATDVDFIQRRQARLKLDIEASGFWSTRIGLLRSAQPKAQMVFVFRDPVEWIESVVAHFARVKREVQYDYVEEWFFRPFRVC